VENYPGFTDGIMGPDLMLAMRAQAERFGAEIITDDVASADLVGEVKTVTDAEGNQYSARSVILAMGSGYRKLGLPAEEVLNGRGVSWCATCDGFFFRDKDIAVVGGGDSALEEATFLTRFAKTVTIIHRRDELRGSKIMIDRANADPKIRLAWTSVVSCSSCSRWAWCMTGSSCTPYRQRPWLPRCGLDSARSRWRRWLRWPSPRPELRSGERRPSR